MEPIGAKLKKIRLEKGLSLEEAHKKTKIHLNILKAIEEGSVVDLNPVYLKGFLKIYCKFLGLDFKDSPADSGSEQAEPAPIKTPDNRIKPVSFIQSASSKMGSLDSGRKTNLAVLIISAILFLLAVLGLGKIIALKHSRGLAQKRAKAYEASQVKLTKKTEVSKAQKTRTLSSIPRPQIIQTGSGSNISGVRLTINAREDCWIKVKSDGKLLYHGILKKGRPDSWFAKEKINLSLGNAGVVDLNVNGQVITSLGRKGQAIKDIVITKGGLSVQR
jgi:transcriptional regulator with XRE-family HTH domain